MKIPFRAFVRTCGMILIILGAVVGVLIQIHNHQVQESVQREVNNFQQREIAVEEIQASTSTTTVVREQPKPTYNERRQASRQSPTRTTTTTTNPPPSIPASVIPNDVFGWVNVESINLFDMPLLAGNIEDNQVEALDGGAAYWPGTSLPGAGGNVVIGGHRTSHLRPFYFLPDVKEGDEIEVGTRWGTYTYRVYAIHLNVPARRGNEEETLIRTFVTTQVERPGETVTLYTCNLKEDGGWNYRVIVQGDLVRINGVEVSGSSG